MTKMFAQLANWVAVMSGHPVVFGFAIFTVIAWMATGPFFAFSDTWQLVMNTWTNVATFLMVFLIQNSQNRDSSAIQAKILSPSRWRRRLPWPSLVSRRHTSAAARELSRGWLPGRRGVDWRALSRFAFRHFWLACRSFSRLAGRHLRMNSRRFMGSLWGTDPRGAGDCTVPRHCDDSTGRWRYRPAQGRHFVRINLRSWTLRALIFR